MILVVGASNGYGLAARIVSTFGSGAASIGVAYERPGTNKKPATAGWYNTEAFKNEARKAGCPAWNVNGDAFSEETKTEVVELIKENLGQVDFLVYSIAAPRRIDPKTGEVIGYLFDSMRCIAQGRGKRQGNREIIEWEWSATAQGATSVSTTEKDNDNKFTYNHKYILPNGNKMEDTIEFTRKTTTTEK